MRRETLYTPPGCTICESVRRAIESVRERIPFEFEIRNITDDPADHERYKQDIPVVTPDGREVARHPLSAEEFEELLCRS